MKCYKILVIVLFALVSIPLLGQESLDFYLKMADDNPYIKSAYQLYTASLQRIPQAGAIQDPQVESGFFLHPMDIVGGQEIAQFSLMQMFPWFGTRKVAQAEARHMAKMAYEQYREIRDGVYLQIYFQWYKLCALRQKQINNETNREFLKQLEQLSLHRYTTGTVSGKMQSMERNQQSGNVPTSTNNMSGMNMGKSQTTVNPSMEEMETSSMAGISMGRMSDVLRIQLEIMEIESSIENICSEIVAEKSRFNILLNRQIDATIDLSLPLVQTSFVLDVEVAMQTIEKQNPMLNMVAEEQKSYQAKLAMDRKMGYPMFGIGLQYMLVNPSDMHMKNSSPIDMMMPMFSISIPVYRSKYKAAQKESKFLSQASEMKYINTRNQLQAELYYFKYQLEDAERKIRLYEQQYQLAQSVYNINLQEFISGGSLDAVLQMQQQLLSYKLREIETIATYNTVVANIKKLTAQFI